MKKKEYGLIGFSGTVDLPPIFREVGSTSMKRAFTPKKGQPSEALISETMKRHPWCTRRTAIRLVKDDMRAKR